MKLSQNLQKVLDKKMDRKEFIKSAGVASMFVVGGGMVANSVTQLATNGQPSQPTTKTTASQGRASAYSGYGVSMYGDKL